MKRYLFIICIVLLCLTFAACGATGEQQPPDYSGVQDVDTLSEAELQTEPETDLQAEAEQTGNLEKEEGVNASAGEGTLIKTDYGSYILPDGWYQFEQISTDEKPFYLKEGVGTESVVSNISVECGTNRYARENHLDFRAALVAQLGAQASAAGMQMTASGSFTAAGDILYVFTLSDNASSTVQYYIVGDNRYVLMHVTDLMDERIPEVNATAAAMADSFTWA